MSDLKISDELFCQKHLRQMNDCKITALSQNAVGLCSAGIPLFLNPDYEIRPTHNLKLGHKGSKQASTQKKTPLGGDQKRGYRHLQEGILRVQSSRVQDEGVPIKQLDTALT